MSADPSTPPDPYRLAALAVLERAGVPLVWADEPFWTPELRCRRLDLSAAADQMRAELEAAEARGYARASQRGVGDEQAQPRAQAVPQAGEGRGSPDGVSADPAVEARQAEAAER